MSCWTDSNLPIQDDVPIGPRTTWKIGGAAAWYAEPRSLSELGRLLGEAERKRVRVLFLGNGSNLLIRDEPVHALVVHLGAEAFQALEADGRLPVIRVGAGVALSRLVRFAADQGLAGLEPLAGIPGTVGGAVMTNAGAARHAIGQFVREAGVVDLAGRFNRLGSGSLFFSYRRSNLDRLAVTDVLLRLRRDDPEAVRERTERALREKRKTQPVNQHSAGCVFRNPSGDSAGRLIDAAGLKGYRQGDAVISDRHANFFLNIGHATCRDMLRLIEIARWSVAERFGINLELEIRLWV